MKRRMFCDTPKFFTLALFALMSFPLVQAQSSKPNEDFEKGMKFYEAAQYAEAATAFKRVIDKDHNNAEAYFQLGNSYFLMLRNKDAVKAYQRTIELKPDHLLAYNNMGTAYHRLAQFKDAIRAYEEAVRINPDYADAVFGLGVAYLELRNTDAALEQHKKLTIIDIARADKLYAYITDKKIPLTVLNGKALSLPKPSYPPLARSAHASGTVLVWVSIDESGKVISASVVAGHPVLRAEALQAAQRARFSPTLLEGRPVKVTGIISYNFVAP
jgi:TonB family protein